MSRLPEPSHSTGAPVFAPGNPSSDVRARATATVGRGILMAAIAAIAVSWTTLPVRAQFVVPNRAPLKSAAQTGGLIVTNVISEYFDTTSPTSTWTIASDTQGPALTWSGGGTSNGFRWKNYGHGMAWQPWQVGANAFDLKFDHAFLSGSLKGPSYQSAIPQLYGGYVAISTDAPGAQTRNTISIVAMMSQSGPIFSVRQGILYYLESTVTPSGPNGVNIMVNNGDRLCSAMVGQYVWINGTGPYQIQSVTSATTATLVSGASILTTFNHVTMGADVELSNLSTPGGAQTIQWPLGAPLTMNPLFTVEISRSLNTLTFNLFTPTFQGGTAPWGLTPGTTMLANGNSYQLAGGAASANFQYLIISNRNDDHLTNSNTGWTGGPTSTAPTAPGMVWQGLIQNIRGYGSISSGTNPNVTAVMPASTTTLRSGQTAMVYGAGFETGGTIRIGFGSTLQTVTPIVLDSSTLMVTLPTEADGNYTLKYISPSGVEAQLNCGITYSGATITRIDPHEASPAGGETLVVTGAGFDSHTTVTLCGVNVPVTVIDAFHLQLTTPPCSPGIPTVIAAGSGGTFFTSTGTAPSLAFGYSNHPYMNFNSAELAAINSKWTDPRFADYTAQLKRNVSISAALSGVSGTFQVGDTVTQTGGATGTAYGYQYGMLVVYPISGVFGPGPIAGPTGSGYVSMVFSVPRMLASFTVSLTAVAGTFNIGETVTQGKAAGQVYGFDGRTLGIIPNPGPSFLCGTPLTGPSGSGTPTTLTLNSPNDTGGDSQSAWQLNMWEDYGWFNVLSGTNTYANQFFNGTPDLVGNGILTELNRIDFTDHYTQSFDLERSAHVAMFYDAMWPSLTLSQRTQFLNYLDRVHSYCNAQLANYDTFMVPTSDFWNNWIAIGNSGCIQVDLALMNSVYSVAHGPTPDLTKHVTDLRNPTSGYISREMGPDGVILEGSLYSAFGLSNYIWAGRSCQHAMGTDTCGAGGVGLLSMPNFLQNYQQTNLTFSGDAQWFTFCDTQPSLFGEAILTDEGERFHQPNLLYVADDFAHRIATGNGFIGQLNEQASGWDVAPPAFLWRSTTPASFSGWPTTAYGSSSNLAVIRSDGANYQPNLVIGMKGQSADAAINGHRHFDAGSFVVQDRGQAMFIDPGYNQPNAPQHSTPTVDGYAASTGNKAYVATVDSSAVIDTPTKRSIAMAMTATYPQGVKLARRTITAYQDKAFVVLDDIVPSGAGATVGNFQAGFRTTSNGTGFTIAGPTTSLICTPYGPTTKTTITGPLSFGLSWVFANLGVQWYDVSLSYTATAANPLALVCIDNSSSLTATFANSGSILTVTFSDSTTFTYAYGGSGWRLQ